MLTWGMGKGCTLGAQDDWLLSTTEHNGGSSRCFCANMDKQRVVVIPSQ